MILPTDQGRAPGLYDEQLQRVQQEKRLIEGADGREGPILFAPLRPASPADGRKTDGA